MRPKVKHQRETVGDIHQAVGQSLGHGMQKEIDRLRLPGSTGAVVGKTCAVEYQGWIAHTLPL
jgi:hypothetical protein